MNLKLDGHKLFYHLDELNKWNRGESFYPLYVELSPTTLCNHRCVHCYIRYLGFKAVSLEREIMLKLVRDLGALGVKALCLAGTGEPFLNKATPEVIRQARKSGLDVAAATNGVLFKKDIAERVLRDLTWIRFSVLGGSPATYTLLQGAKRQDWGQLLRNLKDCVAVKSKQKLQTTIGVVFFIFKDNGSEVLRMAKMMKDTGVDYFVVKPVGDYKKNNFVAQKHLKEKFGRDLKKVELLATDHFRCQVRWDMFEKWEVKPYKECLSLPFMTIVDSDAGVYACGGYWQDKRYLYGNLHGNSFKEIWDSPRRKRIMNFMQKHVNFADCYNCCRNHSINQFLWNLKQVPQHVNFI